MFAGEFGVITDVWDILSGRVGVYLCACSQGSLELLQLVLDVATVALDRGEAD
jgi:hypothetical protein